MVLRACGERVQGGIYAEVATSPDGEPLEHFLLEPPIIVPDDVELPARGVVLVPKHRSMAIDGVWEDLETRWNICDRLGTAYYPNVADWIEETRYLGASRRLPSTLDFSKLDEYSKLWVAHDRAWIDNWAHYYPHLENPPFCRKRNPAHEIDDTHQLGPSGPRWYYRIADQVLLGHHPPDFCIGLWWEDLDPLSVSGLKTTYMPGRANPHGGELRILPALTYCGRVRPERVEPRYRLAIFAKLPLARIVVVRGEGAAEAMEKASAARLPVEEVDV